MFAQPVALLLGTSRPEEAAKCFAPFELGNGAETDDAILGEPIDESIDVPRHEQRLDVAHEGTRFLNRTRVPIVLGVCGLDCHSRCPPYKVSPHAGTCCNHAKCPCYFRAANTPPETAL